MQTSTKQSVIAIVLDESKMKVLLIERRDVPIWVLPGGGVEFKETPEEAVIREVEEETGLKVSIDRQVALYTPINRLTHPTYVYQCAYYSGELKTGEETRCIGFYPFDSLPKPFFFLHQEWMNDARKNQAGLICKPLDQVTYLQLLKYFCLHPLQVCRLILSRMGFPLNSK